MIRIGFFGTPDLARSVLADILSDTRFEVVFVVTNPDAMVGRGGTMKTTAVKTLATEHAIPVYTPEKVRWNTELFESLQSYDCDYFVVVAYGKILPNEILEMPKKLCVNVHGSILPKYRGASPIQSALLSGDAVTGVAIMAMSEGMDEGDVLSILDIPIDEKETSGSLFLKFAAVSGKFLCTILVGHYDWQVRQVPQPHQDATYCKKIQKEDGHANWNDGAEVLYRKWQAYTPWPGLYTFFDEKRLVIEGCEALSDSSDASIGSVVRLESWKVWVQTSQGILIFTQLKLEWKKSLSIEEFLRGQANFIWKTLS